MRQQKRMHWIHYKALCRPNPNKRKAQILYREHSKIPQVLIAVLFMWFCAEYTKICKIYFLSSKMLCWMLSKLLSVLLFLSIHIMEKKFRQFIFLCSVSSAYLWYVGVVAAFQPALITASFNYSLPLCVAVWQDEAFSYPLFVYLIWFETIDTILNVLTK